MKTYLTCLFLGFVIIFCRADEMAVASVDSLHFSGNADTNQASFQLSGRLKGLNSSGMEPKLIYAAHFQHGISINTNEVCQRSELRIHVMQGKLREVTLALRGNGNVMEVAGNNLLDWGVRISVGETNLIIRVADSVTNAPVTNAVFTVKVREAVNKTPFLSMPLRLIANSALFQEGSIEINTDESLSCSPTNLMGLMPVNVQNSTNKTNQPVCFHYANEDYLLGLNITEKDTDSQRITWTDFLLTGQIHDREAAFVAKGKIVVPKMDGGEIEVLSGEVALSELPNVGQLRFESGRYLLKFTNSGVFSIELKFNARVAIKEDWNAMAFSVASGVLRPITLTGLDENTEVRVDGASKPVRRNDGFISYLPATGVVNIAWKTSRNQDVGQLLYSARSVSQFTVSPGLLSQSFVIDFKVMQGETNQLSLCLSGEGEVVRVTGENVLGWLVETGSSRRLVVKLNQVCRDHCQIHVQTQTALQNFPTAFTPVRLVSNEAIRFDGYLMIGNNGAVKLDVGKAEWLYQISPEFFPKDKEFSQINAGASMQCFAFRFASAEYDLSVRADNILPEIAVSELVHYHLGENDVYIESEMELDIREAPLREFEIQIPSDYTVSKVQVAQLADFNVLQNSSNRLSCLKLSFAQPLSGRQIVQLRLEKNQTALAGIWQLPLIAPRNAKSVRGSIGVSADTGLRLSTGEIQGMSEIANAYFPRKIAGLQNAWRLRDENWQGNVKIERLSQTVQADVTHLFVVNDGVINGSTILNYLISGAPVSSFKVTANEHYANVEFTGRDIRNWKQTDSGYEVFLQSPVYGDYTLLATFDHQFNERSNLVSFTGVRAAEVQAEQGHVLIVSDQPLQVMPSLVSGVLPIEPAEVAPEERLLFDAPILAAYQYSSRPFDLQMKLTSLKPGEAVGQIVDRALLETKVSRQGEVMTTAQYYVKNQGFSHMRMTLPSELRLWEAKVNGEQVVPVIDKTDILIPLPKQADPQVAVSVVLNMAATSSVPTQVFLKAPSVAAPVMLIEWKAAPEDGHQLKWVNGNIGNSSAMRGRGFDWFASQWSDISMRWMMLSIPVLILLSGGAFRWATGAKHHRWDTAHVWGSFLGLVFLIGGCVCLVSLFCESVDTPFSVARSIGVMSPILEPGQVLQMHVLNTPMGGFTVPWSAWPILIALALWIGLFAGKFSGDHSRFMAGLAGWVFLCWGVLNLRNSVPAFLVILTGFLLVYFVWPVIQRQRYLPRSSQVKAPVSSPVVPIILFVLFSAFQNLTASQSTVVANSLEQSARIQGDTVRVEAELFWQAEEGQRIDFLAAPAVLIHCHFDKDLVRLIERSTDGKSVYSASAQKSGLVKLSFEYQVKAISTGIGSYGVVFPTAASLVNRLNLQIDGSDVEVKSSNSVSTVTTHFKDKTGENTKSELILTAIEKPFVEWSPRSRDLRQEQKVFYAELHHVFVPMAGLVEGIHQIQIRPAQGQLSELEFLVPSAMTVTDVQSAQVTNWRISEDVSSNDQNETNQGRILRVQLTVPQSKPFSLRIFSQQGSQALPYEQTIRLISMRQSVGQVGLVAVMTDSEVQLDSAMEKQMSAINLEDFPLGVVSEERMRGLAIRRAYRYSDMEAFIKIGASAVQPDVRVESQETFSLGEERSLLVSQLSVHILRAGIFKLSFVVPKEYEVESLTGATLSHWTESRSGDDKIVTLNLKGKTEGDQSFNITLAGPGVTRRNQSIVPRLVFREAGKHIGQLVFAPEAGIRIHVTKPEGLSQLDPKKAGITQKNVLAFRLLRPDWELPFEIENVEPWIEVASLQDVVVRDSQFMVSLQMDYQIENAGVRSLLIEIPSNAQNARFEGDLISDAVKISGTEQGVACWNVKLQRRVIGTFSMRVSYQIENTNGIVKISGARPKNVNIRHAWLAVHTDGRLQVQFPSMPASLQSADWQSVPANLRRSKDMVQSKDCFAVLEPEFELPIQRARHEAVRVIPARGESLQLKSLISNLGEVLTEGTLTMHPGDKRLLSLKLPHGARFWHASINGSSALPWRDGDKLAFLLEKSHVPDGAVVVNFTFATDLPTNGERHLIGPMFDLPVEDITWTLNVPEDWRLQGIHSTLQQMVSDNNFVSSVSLEKYLSEEKFRLFQKTMQAGEFLKMGNSLVQQGTPFQARRAFESAWKLSTQDAALNEDARVQLQNLKMQQALLGLDQGRLKVFDSFDRFGSFSVKKPFTQWVPGQLPDYTQGQMREVLDNNAAEDNAALMKLAERLVRQQSDKNANSAVVQSTVPEFGRQYVFKGAMQVSEWADMNIKFDVGTEQSGGKGYQWLLVLGLLGLFLAIAKMASRRTN